MLEIRDLEVRYGSISALQGISAKVETGTIVTLVGANGAGKPRPPCGRFPGSSKRGVARSFSTATRSRICRRTKSLPAASRRRRKVAWFSPISPVRERPAHGRYLRRDKQGIATDLDYVFGIFPRAFANAKSRLPEP